MDDEAIVARQIGRRPRGSWDVVVRCRFGRPAVIGTAPKLESGAPFPTLYWLTCPWLARRVSALESAGGAARWAAMVAGDPDLQSRLLAADAEYRARRVVAGAGGDPCDGTGLGGQRRPQGTKCLHLHVAAALAGIADPIGEGVMAETGGRECGDDECAALEREHS